MNYNNLKSSLLKRLKQNLDDRERETIQQRLHWLEAEGLAAKSPKKPRSGNRNRVSSKKHP